MFFIQFGFVSAQMLEGLPSRKPAEDAPLPEIAAPDYSALDDKRFDPNLKITLEKIRDLYNKLRLINREDYSWERGGNDFYVSLFGPVPVAGDYIQMLKTAGMEDEADKILDAFPTAERISYRYNIREYLKHDCLNLQPIVEIYPDSATGNALQLFYTKTGENGKYQYFTPKSKRGTPKNTDSSFWSMNVRTNTDEAPKPEKEFDSYFDWADYYMERHKADLAGLDEEISKFDIYTRHDDFYGYALLLYNAEKKEEAEQLIERITNALIKNEIWNAKQRNIPVPEIFNIQSFSHWENLIRYQLRTKQYDAAEKSLKTAIDSRENIISPEIIVYFYLRERGLDEAMRIIDEYYSKGRFGNDSRPGVMLNIAKMLVQMGQIEDAQKILDEKDAVYPYEVSTVKMLIEKYKAKHDPEEKEKTLVELRKLLDGSTQFNKYPNLPRLVQEQNDLGLLFLKLGDRESAKKVFDHVDDSIATHFLNSNSLENGQATYNDLIEQRYLAGYKDETLDFIENKAPAELGMLLSYWMCRDLSDKIDKDELRKILDLEYKCAIALDVNPGIIPTERTLPFQNDGLVFFACSALSSGYYDEAVKAIQKAKELDAKLPPPKPRKAYSHNNNETPSYDWLWINCFISIINQDKPDIDSAFLAVNQIEELIWQYESYKTIARYLLRNINQGPQASR